MKGCLVHSRGSSGFGFDPVFEPDGWEKTYAEMSEEEKKRLVDNISGSLSRVGREEIIEKSINAFRSADKDFGDRLTKAVKALRQKS